MEKVRIAINGFGRIGRQVFRTACDNYRDNVEIVAINDLMDARTNFHLLKYDSSYGQASFDVDPSDEKASVGGVEYTPGVLPAYGTAFLENWKTWGTSCLLALLSRRLPVPGKNPYFPT